MKQMGWRNEFIERPWAVVREFEAEVFAQEEHGQYLIAIIDSVLRSGKADLLAMTTSMHDLLVVDRPLPEPPLDVVVVRAPGSLQAPTVGCVLIEHLAVSGRNTAIERPEHEAVPLFWRFVEEKFGIVADRG